MRDGRWQEIERLFSSALKRKPEERAAYLDEACGDESLTREVESLLACQSQAKGFMESPALEVAAQDLARDQSSQASAAPAGRTLSHYNVIEKLGEGGMGVVYKAIDTRLNRPVALKVLAQGRVSDPERKRRFIKEARAASALNHPNIVTIYDTDQADGVDFIAMEYVAGKTLGGRIGHEGLPIGETLTYAAQIAGALAAAHAAGIVHRDLKPSNIMVGDKGLLKVVDFGLAKLRERPQTEKPGTQSTVIPLTNDGMILGTAAYMSPEQAEGAKVDSRSDIFSFGSVLYEMLTGEQAFHGSSRLSTMSSVLRDTPAPLKAVRPDLPTELDRILWRCLQKDRGARYPSATELHKDMVECQSRFAATQVSLRSALHRPRIMIAVLALLALLLVGIGWVGVSAYLSRWAHTVALPEITRLMDQENYVAALRLARKVDRYAPNQTELQQLRRDFWVPISIYTEQPGADLFIRDYATDKSDWEPLGKSPVEKLRLPAGEFCIRITKPGFEEVEGTLNALDRELRRTLHPAGTAPPGMVFVPVDTFNVPSAGAVKAGAFWLDKYEVTNRQFKAFVDRGGYRKQEYWKHPFVENGRALSWEDAMTRFVDSTGRPGPATWEFGSFAEGREDYPVGGVSWYEAAAYAEFAGKYLPTDYHWVAAANFAHYSTILHLSNFQGEGPARVGSYRGVGRFGTYDMAGNVTEWCWNPTNDRRCIRGGAWPDPNYMYFSPDAASPFERGPTRGFRCAKYTDPLPETLTGPVVRRPTHDYTEAQPAGDDVFRSYKSIYAYDRTDLQSRIESVDDTSPWWRRERVSFSAAYANERVIAFVFLPRNAVRPYQTILFFPGGTAQRERTSENLELRRVDFLLRSGRAVVYPIYKGTYERYLASAPTGPNAIRDLRIQWAKDVGRSIDYIQTRIDLDQQNLAFYGISGGAGNAGPIVSAIESRFKTSILQSGGLSLYWPAMELPGEANPFNFLPRVKIPVLMMNGRDDFISPLEKSQIPMFRLLGTPEKDKRHTLFNSGHALPRAELIKEVLAWLDHYLGPVKPKEP